MKTRSIRITSEITLRIIIFVISVFFTASVDTLETGTTIAYIGDAEIFGESGIPELTKDFNQIIPQSPTGKVDAVVMLGDMDLAAQAMPAYSNSTARDIPVFYTTGNHDSQNIYDISMLKTMFEDSLIPLNPGPAGTDKTTYSFDIGRLHIISMNEYWDGNFNGVCDWKIPAGGVSADETCFKYSTNDGGYVPDVLMNWINDDLSGTSQPWKVVIGHEPLYPQVYHIGNSLDRNKQNRDKLQNLFVTKKVAVFLSGHTHTSGVQLKDGIYHVGAGVTGLATTKGEDPFASLIYTHIDQANDLILTWKRENPTWNAPITASYTIKNVIQSSVNAIAGGPYAGTPGDPVYFAGSASGGTAPYSYYWNFGDGSTSSLANPAHAYSNKGSYTASLTVTDSEGRVSSPDTASVSIEYVRFINGTVFDKVTKTGIPGVIVSTNTSLSTITNPAGFYSFPVNPGTYNIMTVFEPEYFPNSTTVSVEFTGVVEQDILLLKKPVGTIQGTAKIG